MASGNRSSLFVGLSAIFYLVLLFSPLAFFQTAHAQSDQDPLQESYGTGKLLPHFAPPQEESLLLTILPSSYWYRSRNYLLLRWCDAKGQS